MKKYFKYFLTFFILTFTLLLAACGDSTKTKLPTNEHDKVTYAFNGVENSFKKKKIITNSNNRNVKNSRLNVVDISSNTLDQIKAVYVNGDIIEDGIDGLEYDQPPMIQFQCLKAIYEKIGDDFTFDNKYFDTITGQIYLDLETGEVKADSKDSAYLVSYEFGLAIDIKISTDDLITADVSFDITLIKGNDSYNTKWYCYLILDYDMEKTSPNYKLTMYTANNEKELSYRNMYTYEYDYVEVVDNAIKEWRKFDIESDTKLIKDNNHQTFQSYLDENIEFRIGTSRWFYDGEQRKVHQMTDTKAATLGTAYFEGLGLNNTDINDDAFFNITGEQNDALKAIYASFSKIFGFDLIYALVDGGESSGGGSGYTPVEIALYDVDGNIISGYEVNNTTLIEHLVAGFYDVNSLTHINTKLYYRDKDGQLQGIPDRQTLDYYFTAKRINSNETYDLIKVDLDDSIADAYSKLIAANNITSNDVEDHFYIIPVDANYDVRGNIEFIYHDYQYTPTTDDEGFPKELSDLKIPEYKTEKGQLKYNSSTKYLAINGSNLNEASTYKDTLKAAGFGEVETQNYWVRLNRKYDDTQELYLTFDYSNDIFTLHYEIKEREKIEITSVGIIGLNGWDLEYNVMPFEYDDNEGAYFVTFNVEPDNVFKIVANQSWNINDGGYGYSDVDGLDAFEGFGQGEYNNIEVARNAILRLKAIVSGETILLSLVQCDYTYKITKGKFDSTVDVIIKDGDHALGFDIPIKQGTSFTIDLFDSKERTFKFTITDANGTAIYENNISNTENLGPFTLDRDLIISFIAINQ